MPLRLFKRIRRHAAISTGNFETLFREIPITPLPAATARLLEEISRPEADMEQIGRLIASLPEISAQVLKTVNSSLYNLRTPVLSIQHAVNLLGLDNIRSIALSFAVVNGVPRPDVPLFDHQGFWSDCLIRALVARLLARYSCPQSCNNAFTAMLISDVALPVLLKSWSEYYQPVVDEWQTSGLRLSAIEQNHFGWNHAQAGAWILQHWNFPEQMICFVGVHNAGLETIRELELQETIALPLALASSLPSSLHDPGQRAAQFVSNTKTYLGLSTDDLLNLLEETEQGFLDIYELMGLCQVGRQPVLEAVREVLERETET